MKRAVNILVVDDEPFVLHAITRLLKHVGHAVEAVGSGDAALAILAERTFDLVITDFSMPDMPGDQLALRIRELIPEQRVIMASAQVTSDEAPQMVDAVLLKPFSLDELSAAIERVMAQ